MSIDSFILKLAILMVPGFITLKIVKTFSSIPYSETKTLSTYDLFIILIISIVEAAIFDLISPIKSFNITFSMFEWIVNFEPSASLPLKSTSFFLLLGISIVLGLAYVLLKTLKTKCGLLKNLSISNSNSGKDIWCSFAEENAEGNWVSIRDYSKKVIYRGYISSVSNMLEKREIVLYDVTVYKMKDTSDPIIETEAMYIPLIEGEFTVEIQESN